MMKKNSESNLNESKGDYAQQKVLEDGYAALTGQLKHPVGPSYTKQFPLRGGLAIADIPGAQAGSRRHATIRGQQTRMLNPNDPAYAYPGNNELILKVSRNN